MTHDRNSDNTTRHGEAGKVKIMFFPGCLVLSIIISVVGTILLNVLIRAFN